MINNNLLLENILNLFDEAEKLLEKLEYKIRNNEFDINLRKTKAVMLQPDLLIKFKKIEPQNKYGGFYNPPASEVAVHEITLNYREDILKEWNQISSTFIHEYTHYIGFIKTQNLKALRKVPTKSKRRQYNVGDIDETEARERYSSTEITAYVSTFLYDLYYELRRDFLRRVRSYVNGCLMGTMDINDVEKKIDNVVNKNYTYFYETSEPKLQIQLNIKRVKRHMSSQLRKIKKRLYDIFLEEYYKAEN